MQFKQFLDVHDVARICGVGTSKAYKIIREMNKDLASKGYLTIHGKVPAAYFEEKIYGTRVLLTDFQIKEGLA